MRACVRACVHACVCVHTFLLFLQDILVVCVHHSQLWELTQAVEFETLQAKFIAWTALLAELVSEPMSMTIVTGSLKMWCD